MYYEMKKQEKTKTGRYVGTTEDRINKWMRMMLHWQFDIRREQEQNASYYFTKYHVGKYPKKYFEDIKWHVIDRDYVIHKMNQISAKRMKRDRDLGLKSNQVRILQDERVNAYICESVPQKGVKVDDKTVVKTAAQGLYDLGCVSTQRLRNELASRQQ